jgi:glycosyltransferase involved in cell wall biosynthesis
MIVYVGPLVTAAIKEQRRLPAFNPAGSNRLHRLAQALVAVDREVVCLAPGTALRMGWARRGWHRGRIVHQQGVPTLFCRAVGMPVAGMLLAPVFLILELWRLSRRRPIEAVLVYGCDPAAVFVASFARWGLRQPVILELEDIYVPRWSDWGADSEISGVRQAALWPCMKLMIALAQAFVVPTRRFLPQLKPHLPVEVVTGCMRVCPEPAEAFPVRPASPLHVLFAGRLEFEHGLRLLADAVDVLERSSAPRPIEFDVCGQGSKEAWFRQRVAGWRRVVVRCHGFLPEVDYRALLAQADVCLALQHPAGREAQANVPSKAYEFMCSGKATVVTRVGDLAELPAAMCLLLEPYTPEALASELQGLSPPRARELGQAARAYALAHWDLAPVGQRLCGLLARSRAVVPQRHGS